MPVTGQDPPPVHEAVAIRGADSRVPDYKGVLPIPAQRRCAGSGRSCPPKAPRGTSGAVRTRPETAPDLRSPLTESNRRPSPYHGAHRPAPYLAQCDAVYWLGHSLGMIKLSEPL